MRSTIFAVALLLGTPAWADIITVDFEELEAGYPTSFVSKGVNFTSDFGFGAQVGGPGSEFGSYVLGLVADAENSLSMASGVSFDLISWDVRIGIVDMTVTGFLESGGTVSTTISSTSGALETYNFSSAWTGLTSVQFTVGDFDVLDNVVISAVPLPAAVWLFGSALAGLGWIRRKRA